MPQKTRKEKIAAASRRNFSFSIQDRPAVEYKASPKNVEHISPDIQRPITQQDVQEQKFFAIDLKKSLILASFIIALEFLLKFARIDSNFLR